MTELESLQETVKRLNRRCQAAESALNETVREKKRGPSFGRSLLNWYAGKLEKENQEFRAIVVELAGMEKPHNDWDCDRCELCQLWLRAQKFKEEKP